MKLYTNLSALCIALSLFYQLDAQILNIKSSNELTNHLSNSTAVVEFFSPTCSHCKHFNESGVFEQLAAANPDVRFARVSYFDVPKLFGTYQVYGFPTFVFLKNGKEISEHRAAGVLSKTTIQNSINKMKK